MDAKPSLTAIGAAQMRAAHLLFDGHPKIFSDDFALRFSGENSEASLRRDIQQMLAYLTSKAGPEAAEQIFRVSRALMISRSRFTEDALLHAISEGTSSYVILGAGLDSFAWRHPELAAVLKVFEIDQPASQQWKRARLQELEIDPPGNLIFLPIDLEHRTLFDGLREAEFPVNRPAFFSWLGVTQYLTTEAVMATFKQMIALGSGTQVSFTFIVPPSQLAENERRFMAMAAAAAGERGEPWITYFEPAQLALQLRAMGFRVLEHLTPDDANNRYFADRTDRLRVPGGEHVMLIQAD